MNKLISPVLSPTKNDFRRELDLYRRTFPYKSEYVGMSNPYDSSIIRNSVDYDLYLREKLFHDMCEKAAAEELQRRSLELQAYAAKRIKKSVWSAVAVALLFFAIILPASVTSSRSAGYETGHADGVTAGYEQGHSAGYKAGTSEGESAGYAKGSDAGYDRGYNAGYLDGASIGNNYPSANTSRLPNTQGDVVYVTASGSKYHRSTCSYLANSKYEKTLASAKSAGYTPCSRCKPPQ